MSKERYIDADLLINKIHSYCVGAYYNYVNYNSGGYGSKTAITSLTSNLVRSINESATLTGGQCMLYAKPEIMTSFHRIP